MAGFPDGGSAHPAPVEPPAGARGGLAPLLWLLAMGWLALQTLGRAGMWLLTAVDASTAAAARACGVGARALLRALGPLGRGLRRLFTPLLRWLRRAWVEVGRRVFLAMVRPLGRFGRWLVQRSRPAVHAARTWARRVAARVEPLLGRLATATEVVERAAARLAGPLRRAAVSLGRRLRPAVASIARRVRARRETWEGPGSRRERSGESEPAAKS
jgi:hypothetical protein